MMLFDKNNQKNIRFKEHCIINSQIELKELTGVSIYRDGGTLESYWLTSANDNFIVTLEFDHLGSELHGQNFYKLYFCDSRFTKNNQSFSKDSMVAVQFLKLVQQWMQNNQYTIESFGDKSKFEYTIDLFVSELFKGNY